jgi:hypothetical protein
MRPQFDCNNDGRHFMDDFLNGMNGFSLLTALGEGRNIFEFRLYQICELKLYKDRKTIPPPNSGSIERADYRAKYKLCEITITKNPQMTTSQTLI